MLARSPSITRIFGLTISNLDAAAVAEQVTSAPRPAHAGVGLVVTPNIDHISLLQYNPAFKKAYDSAEIVTCDGFPVYQYAKWRKCVVPGRVTGCDIVMEAMRSDAILHDHRIFFAVDSAETAQGVRDWAVRRGIGDAVDVRIPSFGFDKDPVQCLALAGAIRAHRTTLLFMCVGAPRSEIFVDTYRSLLPACWALCVGQAVKMEIGTIPRPSELVKSANLEWLWRLTREPKRLAGRYARASVGFLMAILNDLKPDHSPFRRT